MNKYAIKVTLKNIEGKPFDMYLGYTSWEDGVREPWWEPDTVSSISGNARLYDSKEELLKEFPKEFGSLIEKYKANDYIIKAVIVEIKEVDLEEINLFD